MLVTKTAQAKYMSAANFIVKYDEVSICPNCKSSIQPVDFNLQIYREKDSLVRLSIQNMCKSCCSSFLCQYSDGRPNTDGRGNVNYYQFDQLSFCCPSSFVPGSIDSKLKLVSNRFIEIYTQAQKAEYFELEQIAGMGYRKALECLIKDFLISEKPINKDTIQSTSLGNCIEHYVENAELKIAASRATWLGNDQVHYLQKYEDKDISDLKRLIRLSMYWICMIIETRDAELIPHPSTK